MKKETHTDRLLHKNVRGGEAEREGTGLKAEGY